MPLARTKKRVAEVLRLNRDIDEGKMTNDQETQKRYDHRFWQLSVLRLITAQQCLSLYMTASHELYDKSYFMLEENEKHALEEEERVTTPSLP